MVEGSSQSGSQWSTCAVPLTQPKNPQMTADGEDAQGIGWQQRRGSQLQGSDICDLEVDKKSCGPQRTFTSLLVHQQGHHCLRSQLHRPTTLSGRSVRRAARSYARLPFLLCTVLQICCARGSMSDIGGGSALEHALKRQLGPELQSKLHPGWKQAWIGRLPPERRGPTKTALSGTLFRQRQDHTDMVTLVGDLVGGMDHATVRSWADAALHA